MTDEDHIKKVIKRTFNVIKEVYKSQKEGKEPIGVSDSRIIFPQKRNEETRVSEQELRFIFVEQLNKYLQSQEGREWNIYYSVETPTYHAYRGFKSGNPGVADIDENARSGNIDLCIHNKKGKRICLIEFKALNPIAADYSKDFCKLIEEAKGDKEVLRFFYKLLMLLTIER